MRAWHFVAVDGSGRPVLRDGAPAAATGETERHEGALVMCKSGLHFSLRALDALRYAPGAWVRRVDVPDGVETQEDKGVCRERRILAQGDVMRVIVKWTCEEAVNALERYGDPTGDSMAAALLTWAWADGADVPHDQLAAAWAAALAAARAAARDADRTAAWAAARAAARAAAWDAARAAARAAAWDADRTAAWAAARAAAWAAAVDAAVAADRAAARDVAVAAAWAAQNERLERTLCAALGCA